MKLQVAIVAILYFATNMQSQNNDTINLLNSKGKKEGCWIQYINDVWGETTKENAVAYFYNQYDNGKPLLELKGQKWKKKYKLVCEGNTLMPGNPVLLDGVYKWYNSKGQLMNEEHYKNGNPIFMKSYNYSNNNFGTQTYNEVLRFDKKYKNQKPSFYYEELTYGVVRKAYYFRNGEKGWRAYSVDPEEDAYIINDNKYAYGKTPLYFVNNSDTAIVKRINTDVNFKLYLNPEKDKEIINQRTVLKGRLLKVNENSIDFIVTEDVVEKEYKNGLRSRLNTFYSYETEEVRTIDFDKVKIIDVSFDNVGHRSEDALSGGYTWIRGSGFRGRIKAFGKRLQSRDKRLFFINFNVNDDNRWTLKSSL